MKRIYIAIAFLTFSFAVGIIEFLTLNSTVDNYLNSISRIGDYVKQDKFEKAEKLTKKTANSFEKTSKGMLNCYYRHDELEEITEALYSLEDMLDDKRVEDYHEQSHLLSKKLLFLKEKEQITFQNIL